MSLRRALREAYENAVYEADLADGTAVFRIGKAPEGAAPGEPLAILTAWNPAQDLPGGEANERANARLAAEIERHGFTHYPALGRSEDGSHAEASFAVPGISRASARALGSRFSQAAIFYWDGVEARVLSCGE
ncbi:MAG: DUF3293 domain-containing protein [Gammaproteobacteria bacterium]